MPAEPPGRRDVVLYVNSETVVRTLPEDARDAAISGLRNHGEYTFTMQPGWSGHAGASETSSPTASYAHKPIVSRELSESQQEALNLV